MIKRMVKSTFLFFLLGILSCGNTSKESKSIAAEKEMFEKVKDSAQAEIVVGAERMDQILPKLKNMSVGVVGNQTSVIKSGKGTYTHLVDSLMALKINVKKVFAPEHGFRGTADAGEMIKDGLDAKTGLPVISLYGDQKKPSAASLKDIDILVFDIQDVGARFYTYISSLHYIMEACAEQGIPLLILDRPNPNGSYVDGPILEKEHQSFVGMHPVPIVHGLTIAEYAQMINGEKWLKNGIQCDLQIVEMINYDHAKSYSLPVKPSPNLPNDLAVNLYPSLCFFEGTNVNAGRGTSNQFQVFGSPFLDRAYFDYTYTPVAMDGAKYPKHENKKCFGRDLTKSENIHRINLDWLLGAYQHTSNQKEFFNSFFTKLAGTEKLQQQIEKGMTSEEIRRSWSGGLEDFQKKRNNYKIYY